MDWWTNAISTPRKVNVFTKEMSYQSKTEMIHLSSTCLHHTINQFRKQHFTSGILFAVGFAETARSPPWKLHGLMSNVQHASSQLSIVNWRSLLWGRTWWILPVFFRLPRFVSTQFLMYISPPTSTSFIGRTGKLHHSCLWLRYFTDPILL